MFAPTDVELSALTLATNSIPVDSAVEVCRAADRFPSLRLNEYEVLGPSASSAYIEQHLALLCFTVSIVQTTLKCRCMVL